MVHRWLVLPAALVVLFASAEAAAAKRVNVQRNASQIVGFHGKAVGPRSDPIAIFRDPSALVFGLMGSAGSVPQRILEFSYILGRRVAQKGQILLTGACWDIPEAGARGAKEHGGRTVGISAFRTLGLHRRHGQPFKHYDVMKFTELPYCMRGSRQPNFIGRDIDNIWHSNALIYVRGRTGTWNELSIALTFQKPIGILLNSGGIAEQVKADVAAIQRGGKHPTAPIIYDASPVRLVDRLFEATRQFEAEGGAKGPLGD